MGTTGAGVEEADVVVDLGDGADGGAGVVACALLVDGDSGAEAFDVVDIGLLHAAEELAGVGGEGLDVAALALGVDGIEGERTLARAGEAGDNHKLVPGDRDVDVLEVMLAGAFDEDGISRHGMQSPKLRGIGRPTTILASGRGGGQGWGWSDMMETPRGRPMGEGAAPHIDCF